MALGALGIGSICLGVLLLGLRGVRRPTQQRRSWLLALLGGLRITGYLVVDKLGVGLVSPVVYVTGQATVTGVSSSGSEVASARGPVPRHGTP